MKNQRINFIFKSLFYILIFAGPFLIYLPLIDKDPFLNRDDFDITSPLRTVFSFDAYQAKLINNEILDFQPIRDFTYFIDIYFSREFGISTFHASNYIYFCILTLLIYFFLAGVTKNSLISMFVSLLISVHPVTVGSVAWISGRKHILSALFLFLALNFALWLGQSKHKILMTLGCWVSAIFSFFSHPIHLLTNMTSTILVKQSRWKFALGFLLIFSALGAYQLHNFKHEKRIDNFPFRISNVFENLGLMAAKSTGFHTYITTMQKSSFSYIPGLLMILTIFGLLFIKSSRPTGSRVNLVCIFSGLILLPVLTSSRFYTMDTYVLIPSTIFFGLTLWVFYSVHKKLTLTLMLLLYPAFYINSSKLAKTWLSDLDLWGHAFVTAPTPYSALYLANFNQYQRPETALQLLLKYPITKDQFKFHPEHEINLFHYILGRNLYYSTRYSAQSKQEIIAKFEKYNRWAAFFSANLYLKQNNCQAADIVIKPFITNTNEFEWYSIEIVPLDSVCEHFYKFELNIKNTTDSSCLKLKNKIISFYSSKCTKQKTPSNERGFLMYIKE